jgi:hypothetical protein
MFSASKVSIKFNKIILKNKTLMDFYIHTLEYEYQRKQKLNKSKFRV